jgi:hypothetical protein
MILRPVLFAAAFSLLACAANAYNVDDTSMNSGTNAAKYSDPDEQSPVNLQDASGSHGNVSDPTSTRYDYDPSTGNYVPHQTINGQ